MASVCRVDDGERNSYASDLPGVLFLSINHNNVVRQNHGIASEIKNLTVQFHLGSLGEAEPLEALTKMSLLISHERAFKT